jgi:hypothetical protein
VGHAWFGCVFEKIHLRSDGIRLASHITRHLPLTTLPPKMCPLMRVIAFTAAKNDQNKQNQQQATQQQSTIGTATIQLLPACMS